MASGQEHDKTTKQWAVPFACLVALLVDTRSGVISRVAFLIGGLWLSPDLDTNSRSLKRWGILQWCWWPYRKFISHRSILSHGPFIGTVLRIGYLSILTTIIILFLQPFISLTPTNAILQANHFVIENPKESLTCFIGVEASAWLHIIQDGDP